MVATRGFDVMKVGLVIVLIFSVAVYLSTISSTNTANATRLSLSGGGSGSSSYTQQSNTSGVIEVCGECPQTLTKTYGGNKYEYDLFEDNCPDQALSCSAYKSCKYSRDYGWFYNLLDSGHDISEPCPVKETIPDNTDGQCACPPVVGEYISGCKSTGEFACGQDKCHFFEPGPEPYIPGSWRELDCVWVPNP